MDVNKRQYKTFDGILRHNAHGRRVLVQKLDRRHGLADTRDQQTRSINKEMQTIQREYEKMMIQNKNKRRPSGADELFTLRCKKSDGSLKTEESKLYAQRKEKDPIQDAAIPAVKRFGVNGNTSQDSLSQKAGINQSMNADLRSDFNYRAEPQHNNIEFVEEQDISYKSNPDKIRQKHNTLKSWYSNPVPPPGLTLDNPTFYNHARLSTINPPDPSLLKRQEYTGCVDPELDSSQQIVSIGLSSSLLAMAAANNFARSQRISGSESGSVAEASTDSDATQANRERRGSRKITKVNDLLRPDKFDREKFNPDGSIRTVHKLPDFNKSYDQARRARYIRSKETIERDKELNTKEIFQPPVSN